jgi:hypothetical protein
LAARRLPGTVWYVGGRVMLYEQWGVSKTTVLIVSGVELVLTVVASVIVGLVCVPFGMALSNRIALLLIAGATAGLVALHPFGLSLLMRAIGRPLQRPVQFKETLTWLVAYLATWVLGGLMLSQVVMAFQPLELSGLLFVIGAWAISGAAGYLTFLLPSGLGATELALTILLSQLMPLPLATIVAILMRILTTLFELVLSATFFALLRYTRSPAPIRLAE